ncbi:hypothetical protein ACHAXR_001842, partial [Thalassiosira sp. AJA248-18]
MKRIIVLTVLSIQALTCGANVVVGDAISIESDNPSDNPLEDDIQGRLRDTEVPIEHTIPLPPVAGWNGLSREDWPQDLLTFYSSTNQTGSQHKLSTKHYSAGKFPNLVLLLRFADHASRKLPSQEDISRLYNSEDVIIDDRKKFVRGNNADDDIIPTGSVRQAYFSNSHSTFTIETTVVGWIPLRHTESYYASGNHGLSKSKFKDAMKEALTFIENNGPDNFDFGNFDLDANGALDGFGVLHSGYGAEFGGKDCHGTANVDRIWSHKGGLDWTSSTGNAKVDRFYVSSALRGKCHSRIVRIGVLCHEIGHYLGLPDLYDPTFLGTGLGAYDFMSQSWGFDGSGMYPPNLSAWSKLKLGWATAELIDKDGIYELEASLSSSAFTVYKITHGFPDGEYLLLENRQPLGYDSKINGSGGIAVYHIDGNTKGQRHRGYPSQDEWPQNGNHYKVALLAADGGYDLEQGINQGDQGDLWHAGSKLKELGPGLDHFSGDTDTYQGGSVKATGIRIFGFSASGNVMSFQIEGLPALPPTLSPT